MTKAKTKPQYLEPITVNDDGKISKIEYNPFQRIIRWFGRTFNNNLRSFAEKPVYGLYVDGGKGESCTVAVSGMIYGQNKVIINDVIRLPENDKS